MSKNDLVLYDPNTVRDAIDERLRRIERDLEPYRPRGLARLFEDAPTIEDYTERYRQVTGMLRAKAGAAEAAMDYLRVIDKVAHLPKILAQDDELRDMRFANEMKRETLISRDLDRLIAGFEEEIALRKANTARHEAAHRQIAAKGRALPKEAEEFTEEVDTQEALERACAEAIENVRTSDASPEEQKKRIADIRAIYRRKLMEG